jgi:Lrp/AsnC family transcriptional regulator for asnA, asnC and gidA
LEAISYPDIRKNQKRIRKYLGFMYQPDQIDWKIIALLNQNGRMSSAEIARRLGNVSARTVINRIDILVEQGIINICSIVNPDTLEYCVLADVFIKTQPGLLREVAKKIAELPLVSYVVCATGDTDIIISVRAKNIEELYDFVTETIGKTLGVIQTRTYLLPLVLKDNISWLPPDFIIQ